VVTLRTRLTLSFTYILLTIVVALSIPLAINLGRRARAEYATDVLSNVQTIASAIGAERLTRSGRDVLNQDVDRYSRQLRGRVVVTDENGTVLADSDRTDVGNDFMNGLRPEIDIAIRQQQPNWQFRHSESENADILVTAAPIIDNDAVVGAVRVTANAQDVSDAVRATQLGILVIGLAGVVAGVLIAAALAGSLAKPLQRLAGAARRLGRGDLSARAGEVNGGREVVDLAESFDEMAERLERTVQAQREFVANASHQLRTPLTGMKLRLESAIAQAPSDDVRRQLQAAEHEVDRLSDIVNRLLVMASEVEQTPARVDLGDAALRALDRWRDRAARSHALLTAAGDGADAQANQTDVDQILDNLLDNAIAYAPGPVEIETGAAGRAAFVIVSDHGEGIPKEEQAKVTERFYRGRSAPQGGSGLGLAIAQELAEKWGGALDVSTPEGGGVRVEVRFRRSPDHATQTTEHGAAARA
jgi:signal transduction histidine kinase